jgi:AcrR family transcriptional regulator
MAKRAEYLGPERRRPLVLDAATEIFAEGGFADASMSAIAERAQVSKAVLYDCFPGGKQEIYYALLERIENRFMQDMLALLDRTNKMPLGPALENFATEMIDWAHESPLAFQLIFGDAGTADPEITKRAERTKELMVQKMGERSSQIMRSAGVGIGPHADIYNRGILATFVEMARWTLRDPRLERDKIVKAVVQWQMTGFERVIPGDAWQHATE